MEINDKFIEKAVKCKDANELYELAKSEGVDLTLEKAKEYFSSELSDETLENVNGGACYVVMDNLLPQSKMVAAVF